MAFALACLWMVSIAAQAAQPLEVTPDHGPVATNVEISAAGLPADQQVDIVWQSYDVAWDLSMKDGVYSGVFKGRTIERTSQVLTSVRTDSNGALKASLDIPKDIGGTHTIYVAKGTAVLAQGAFRTDISASISPKSGPLGTPITVTVTGFDTSNDITGWYQLFYDNALVGSLTAVTTDGSATFTIPATGGVGKHIVELQNAPFGSAYRALESSPYAWLPTPEFTFEVTEGAAILPPPVEDQVPPTVAAEAPAKGQGPTIRTDVAKGGVGTPMTVRGSGFAPNADVSLKMYNQKGSRVTESGFMEVVEDFTDVKADAKGGFTLQTEVPATLGGIHKLAAFAGGEEAAATHFAVAPTAYPLQPAKGPVGTTFTMYLTGVGWSQTENIFGITYDNRFIGYACGFSTNGHVVVYLKATGKPGWHYVDIYPSFYRNKAYGEADESPFLYRFPILTWQDHPHPLHYRFAFYVTAE